MGCDIGNLSLDIGNLGHQVKMTLTDFFVAENYICTMLLQIIIYR